MRKVVGSVAEAVAAVKDGDTVMFGGFGGPGFPFSLRDALAERGLRDLTIVCNNADFGAFAERGSIKAIICSYPTGPSSGPVLEQIEQGRIALHVTPQGTLAERIRAGGAGLGGFLTPTGIGTELEADWTKIEFGGREYLLVAPLKADVALLHASVADAMGNLIHRNASRNFNPLMAMAARLTIVEAETIVEPGEIDPNHVHVPSAFVDAVVQLPREMVAA
ncbi:MAG: CoA transferase subunit A [Candidatus Velamenicoccus archaeovorus]